MPIYRCKPVEKTFELVSPVMAEGAVSFVGSCTYEAARFFVKLVYFATEDDATATGTTIVIRTEKGALKTYDVKIPDTFPFEPTCVKADAAAHESATVLRAGAYTDARKQQLRDKMDAAGELPPTPAELDAVHGCMHQEAVRVLEQRTLKWLHCWFSARARHGA